MAPQSGIRSAHWLLALLQAASVNASFWTVTSRFAYSYSVSTDDFFSTPDYYTYTETRTLSPDVTPTGNPVSSTTYARTYDDLDIVSLFYAPGAVAETDLEATDYYPTYSSQTVGTIFLMPVTYTAPATCTSSFTWATNEVVAPPTEVIDQISPSSIETEPPTTYSTWTAMAYETWYLTPDAIPITTASEYYYSEYIASCTTPYSSDFTSFSGGDDDDDSDTSYQVCYYYGGCTSLKVWIIIVASIIPALFLLGFVESWFWFRRLMIGKSALRFGTVSWICISLWIACFTRTQSKRSPEDQALLREQWSRMSSGTAFKLWWKVGFRHRYPTELLGQYSRNTVGIAPVAPGGAPMTGVQYGQPVMGQYQVGGPQGPPGYFQPQGGMPPPNGQGYYNAQKDANAYVVPVQHPGAVQSPPPQAPSPSVSPPISNNQYPPQIPSPQPAFLPQGAANAPPIPAPYYAQSPPVEAPLSPQSPPPGQAQPFVQNFQPPQSPPPQGHSPQPNQNPMTPPAGPAPPQGPPPQGPPPSQDMPELKK